MEEINLHLINVEEVFFEPCKIDNPPFLNRATIHENC